MLNSLLRATLHSMKKLAEIYNKLRRHKARKVKADLSHPHYWICVVGGAGLLPAPGTWGSLAALPLAYLLVLLGGNAALFLGIIAVTIIGTFSCNWFERTTKTHDASDIVIDEVAGMWITLLFIPLTLKWWAIAFVLFRIFDIAKPWPINALDSKVDTGFGVMLDDLLAGLYALITIHIILHYWS